MGRIARDSVEEVRRANDVVDVIAGYLPLQKRGGAYWACCPFHDEKTPSFNAHPVRQTFKCFGCGEFGSVIDFVMKFEKLDFVETIEKLADRAAITLQYESGGPTQAERSLRSKALEMMSWAQKGFVANLAQNEAALQYLNDRGLGGDVAKRWGIGYAPDDFNRQTNAAMKKFDTQTIEATGLCKRNDRGWYDFFRGRITFPINDAQGRIVGFGARLLDPDAKAQKYVNSAEGLLFHKSKLLYAMDRLAESRKLKETSRVLLMEGYTDVIAAHEAGFDNAVAPLGTAVTREQLALLRRYNAGITLVLDGDEAGQMAAERGVNVALEAGVDARVAVIRDAKDPYDLLRAKGPEALQTVLDSAKDAFDFKLDVVRSRHDLTRPIEAEQALRELAETVGRAESQSLRELYSRKITMALGLRESAVFSAVGEAHARYTQQATRPNESQPEREAAPDPRTSYEREILRRLYEHPRVLSGAGEFLFPDAFSTPALQTLYREMLNTWDEHGELVPGALLAQLPAQAKTELENVLEHVGEQGGADDEKRLIGELHKLADHAVNNKAGTLSLEALREKKGRNGRKRA